jgi:hypothetical protein
MSSPDKPKPHLRDPAAEKRKTRKQKAIDRGRRDNAAREATQARRDRLRRYRKLRR